MPGPICVRAAFHPNHAHPEFFLRARAWARTIKHHPLPRTRACDRPWTKFTFASPSATCCPPAPCNATSARRTSPCTVLNSPPSPMCRAACTQMGQLWAYFPWLVRSPASHAHSLCMPPSTCVQYPGMNPSFTRRYSSSTTCRSHARHTRCPCTIRANSRQLGMNSRRTTVRD